MRFNFFGRADKVVQILGLVVMLACFPSQGSANSLYTCYEVPGYPLRCDLGSLKEDIIILDKNSSEEITRSFTLDTSNIGFPGAWYRASIDYTNSPLLDKLTSTNFIYLSNNSWFYLGSWSSEFGSISNSLTFSVKFSRAALIDWLGEDTKKTLEFTAYVRVRYYDYQSWQWIETDYYSDVKFFIDKKDYAYIDGLDDITLPQKNNEGFCVSRTTGGSGAAGQITLKVESKNGFKLLLDKSDNSRAEPIGYKMKIGGKNGGTEQEITLSQPESRTEQWDAHPAKLSDESCYQGDNMWLFITMDGSEVSALPGEYTDEVIITVSPAS